MKTVKGTPIWAIILILLLLGNLSWVSWNVYQHTALRGVVKQFKFELLRTNGVSGIGLFEAKTDQPVWTRFNENGKPIIENYFFRGKDAFDIILSSNHPPKYSVYFRGAGKSVTWWLDDTGRGSFTDRIYYNTNGDFFKREIWYNQAWHTVDRQNGTHGIVLNGQWRQFGFDTNGIWSIEAPN
ncbi:MAG TPA: hypothetical protein VFC44_03210 [Candidatus Saccharimonadales bacterium]|nr:hypothetical protein [Candidatus Saccharimonadales bacterium]